MTSWGQSLSARRPRGRAVCACAVQAAAFALVACAGNTRDVVPVTRDVRVEGQGGETAAARGGYLHVARRPLGVVAVAEARGLSPEVARDVAERLADSLDTCATDLGRKGKLAPGAARVETTLSPAGAVEVRGLTLSPGAPVAANALLCLVSPLRLLAFPPAAEGQSATARSLVVEAKWGSLEGPEGPATRDEGVPLSPALPRGGREAEAGVPPGAAADGGT